MLKRLILFLVRKRLELRVGQPFRFTNQKSDAIYFFSVYGLWKEIGNYPYAYPVASGVSLNWLLSDECEIEKIKE